MLQTSPPIGGAIPQQAIGHSVNCRSGPENHFIAALEWQMLSLGMLAALLLQPAHKLTEQHHSLQLAPLYMQQALLVLSGKDAARNHRKGAPPFIGSLQDGVCGLCTGPCLVSAKD